MPFVHEILAHNSVSFIGLEKNTGKTETLNYVLKRLKDTNNSIAITSIGIDGEQVDNVTRTHKPEITVYKNMFFVTSEKHYLQRKVMAEIMDVSENKTALGRLITARALIEGKILLSGPATTAEVKRLIDRMRAFGVNTTLVDGALSRTSLASPTVTEAMVLATGASVSANIPQLVRKTKFVQRLIEIESVSPELSERLQVLNKGLWAMDENDEIHDLGIPSVFLLNKREADIFRFGHRLYASGAISDNFLEFLRIQKQKVELIIQDFTKVFASNETFDAFLRNGNEVKCLLRNKLIAVTVNPVSPRGYRLNSAELVQEMQQALNVPVYDIKQMECTCE